jgi:homoserine dehydrogenase
MAAHNAFYKEAALSLSVPATSTKKVAIAIVGFGLVGRELARQLLAQAPKLRAKYNFEFQINALVRTKGMVLFPTQPSFDSKMTIEQQVTSLSEELERNCEAASMTKLAAFMQDKADKVIIVDCTSSEDVAGRYNAFLRCGINIVAANKKLFSGPFQRLKQVWDALATQPVQSVFCFFPLC